MPYLPAIPPVAIGALVAFGFVVGVVVTWLLARISRTRHLIIQTNESTQVAMIQLERIANAMDRVALSAESREISAQSRFAKEVKETL